MKLNEESITASHEAVQELLPWYVNGTLDDADAATVRAHLQHCAECSADLAWHEKLRGAAPAAPAVDPERALARLMPRLGPQEGAARRSAAQGPGARLLAWLRGWLGNGWMPWALAGQGVLIAGLAVQLLPAGGGGDYHALSQGVRPAGGTMVVMFRADASLADMRRIMQASGARVVDGPTVTGAFVLGAPAGSQARALAVLRADPAVQLAEALTSRSAE